MVAAADIDAEMKGASLAAREAAILAHDAAGDVPIWFSTSPWSAVRSEETIDGVKRKLDLFVPPDFYALGDAASYRRVPMMPKTAQVIADRRKSVLPSRKIARLIHNAAPVQVAMATLPASAQMTDPSRWIEDDANVSKLRSDVPARALAGDVVDGHRKYIVIAPNLDGSRVAIFGGLRSTPDAKQNPRDPWAWQPLSTIHDASYADHSHGLRLVYYLARWAEGDPRAGELVDVRDLFVDPKLSLLVSDQGPFVPRFPNAGASPATWTPPPDPLGPGAPPVDPVATLPPAKGSQLVAGEQSSGDAVGAVGFIAALLSIVSFVAKGRR